MAPVPHQHVAVGRRGSDELRVAPVLWRTGVKAVRFRQCITSKTATFLHGDGGHVGGA
ncbi:MAG: hypothetical protein VYA69_02385 [Gemmatimonadota bacterium]|nr:hypothetical protein [Gemmatimonadota bacterium]